MNQSFEFEDAGRTFVCRVEQARAPRTTTWWWFTVSGDNSRYAPFHSGPRDTEDSVRERIVAYYDELLARRAAPRQPWGRPNKGAASTIAPTSPEDPITPR